MHNFDRYDCFICLGDNKRTNIGEDFLIKVIEDRQNFNLLHGDYYLGGIMESLGIGKAFKYLDRI